MPTGCCGRERATSPAVLVPTIPTPKHLSADGTMVYRNGALPGTCCRVPELGTWVVCVLRHRISEMSFSSAPTDRSWPEGPANPTSALYGPSVCPLFARPDLDRACADWLREVMGHRPQRRRLDDGRLRVQPAGRAGTGDCSTFSRRRGSRQLAEPCQARSSEHRPTSLTIVPTRSAFAGTATRCRGQPVRVRLVARRRLRDVARVAGRGQSLTFGLSSDGTVVVALGTNTPDGPPFLSAQDRVPFKWTAAGGLQLLSTQIFASLLMTPDASSIVGNPTPKLGLASRSMGLRTASRTRSLPMRRCSSIAAVLSSRRSPPTAGRWPARATPTARKTGFVARY